MERKPSLFQRLWEMEKWDPLVTLQHFKIANYHFSDFEIWKIWIQNQMQIMVVEVRKSLLPVHKHHARVSVEQMRSHFDKSRKHIFHTLRKFEIRNLKFWNVGFSSFLDGPLRQNGKPWAHFFSLGTRNGNSVKWKKVETFSQPNFENGIPFYREGTVQQWFRWGWLSPRPPRPPVHWVLKFLL